MNFLHTPTNYDWHILSGAVTRTETGTQLAMERQYPGSATFIRTVWLPRPVDSSKVSAKLQDGILTMTVSKAEDQESIKVPIEWFFTTTDWHQYGRRLFSPAQCCSYSLSHFFLLPNDLPSSLSSYDYRLVLVAVRLYASPWCLTCMYLYLYL